MTTVDPVRFEHRGEPLGLGTATPRLSWRVRTDDPEWAQDAYELRLGASETVRVESAEQVLVPWPFAPLASRTRAELRVRVRSGGAWSPWSDPSSAETGPLRPSDWSARFVSPRDHGAIGAPAPVLSRTVALRDGIRAARVYATAHGVYTASVNGERVGAEVLAPGWTAYADRLCYQAHDVTALLHPGDNTLDVLLGNGWYRGRLGWNGRRAVYGDRLALLLQLEVAYDDGTVEVIGTDDRWTAADSGVLADDLYDGQRTDLRPRPPAPGPVDVLDADLARLTAPDGPPVRVTETVPARTVWRSPSGRTLVDFGQNLVGWVRLTVRGTAAGDEVAVRHAEVLEDGELGVRPLRTAAATDTYVLDDAESAVLEPGLTFHGFRYAEITGADPAAADVEAVVVGSDLRRTGWFGCSEPDLERFHENVVWSMRGNFLSVPTDCPQRDERLGWTGDIQVFAPTASFLFDTAGFLGSWLGDLAADQQADGTVGFVAPNVLGRTPPAAAWGDAAAVVPWVLYERYGDPAVLDRQFASMRGWVDRIAASATDGVWSGGFQFGDWLDPAAPPDDPFAAATDPDIVATAYLARSAQIVADAATVLGRDAAAEAYAKLAADTRRAFAHTYVTGAGRLAGDAPTAYALALAFGLLPTPEQRAGAGRRLADLVRANGFRIATGFVGTPLVADALTASGRPDLAYRLVLERGCPSWLYPVTMGATTIWERWDSMLPDGSINPGQMTSFNHYALGAVADWLHRTVAGLAPAAPGYREITVRPVPYAALTHASARHLTPYGEAAVTWRREDGRFTLDVTVPPGCRATVHVPGAEPVEVRHGAHTWTAADPCAAGQGPAGTVRDLIDAPAAWQAVAEVLVAHGLAADPAALTRVAARFLDATPEELVAQLVTRAGPDFAGDGAAVRAAVAGLLG
ncbi:MAG TPA: family 78 glycoside hydrolase catalytic domain [Streptosporangiaceae bacterium]|jgi:alpha-L-rhamnosidase